MPYIEGDESIKETVIVVRDWQMSYIERGEESVKDSVIVLYIQVHVCRSHTAYYVHARISWF